MHRLAAFIVACIVLCLLALPPALFAQGQAEIISPRPNAVVRDTVSVQGTALHPDFWKYEVWFAPGLNPRDDQWALVLLQETQVQPGGQLALWNSATVPDGAYSLRLRVVRRDGNYDEVVIQPVNVANAEPEPTATAAQSPTPEVTATPVPTLGPAGETPAPVATLAPGTTAVPGATITPLPTFTPLSVLSSPTVITIDQPTAVASSTPAPIASNTGSGGNGTATGAATGIGLSLGVEGDALSTACIRGMGFTLGIFLVIGFLALIRQLIRWVF